MKTFLISTLLVFFASYGLLTNAFAETEANSTCAKITQAAASNDVQVVLQTLPDVEKLWSHEPEAYFRSARQVAKVLGGAQANPDAKQSLLMLFSNIIQKPCPTNDEQAISCFNNKHETILYYFNFNDVRNDKSRLIAVAKFVGEIRSRMIPNYSNRGTGWPGHEILQQAGVMNANAITNPVLKQAYAKAVEDNKKDLIMNRLQLSLWDANQGLTFYLLNACSRFSSSDPKNDDFIREIISNARLTEDERKKL